MRKPTAALLALAGAALFSAAVQAQPVKPRTASWSTKPA